MVIDYEVLKLIWWLFVGVLLIGFALLDGFDLGVGTLLPFVGRTDEQRRVILNAIGPTWEGNQVWFITAGGALFAAWPMVYATAFSGFYWAMLLVLFALFFRPVGFEYRSKVEDVRWRSLWDWGLFAGGAVPALVFGVAFGNLLQGVPFYFDEFLRSYYTGSFWELLNPFALLAGGVSLSMLVCHGAIYLQMRTEGDIQTRARQAATWFGLLFLAAFAAGRDLAGLWHRRLPDRIHAGSGICHDAAGQNGRNGSRGMVGQLQPLPLDDGRPGRRLPGRRPGDCVEPGRPARMGVHIQRHGRRRGYPDRGICHVPVRHAVGHPSRPQPDRIRCHLQPSHPDADVRGGGDFPAHRAALYRLGLPGAAGQIDGRKSAGQRTRRLLIMRLPFGCRHQPVNIKGSVDKMWYFSWILGVLLACAFGIINVMWMETEEILGAEEEHP